MALQKSEESINFNLDREPQRHLNADFKIEKEKQQRIKLTVCCTVQMLEFLYLHEFLSRLQSNNFFDDHGLKPMARKGNSAVFESSNISETGQAMPTKIGVHACYIKPYLHGFLEPIPIN